MAAKILKARREGDEFVVQIHLDETRLAWELADATDAAGRPVRVRTGEPFPDPDWVVERRWNPSVDPAQAVLETARLAAQELLRREPAPGERHPQEGQALDLAAVAAAAGDPTLLVAGPEAETSGDQAARDRQG